MNRLTKTLISLILSTILSSAAGSGVNNDFGGKRVLVIGIDGVRPDSLIEANTPNIDALMAKGIITYNAYAGGNLGTASQQATSSGPGWSSIATGVWVDKHKVSSNAFSVDDFANYPHFMRRIREGYPNAHLSSIIVWNQIDDHIVEKSKSNNVEFLNVRKDVSSDQAASNEAVLVMQNANPDAMFIHYDDVDHAGHASGYSKTNTAYTGAITGVDTYIGEVITAMKARPNYATEDWMVIITTDHGGINNGHGGQSVDERTIFLLASGGATPDGEVSTETPGHVAVPPTALKHLGIAVDSNWGWEEGAFGVPVPKFSANPAGKHVILNWSVPAGGITNHTGYELLRDSVTIANLPLTQLNYTDTPPFPASGTTDYIYEIRFTGSTETALTDTATIGELDLTSNLEMHLKFEDDSLDSTTNNHDATAVGGALYQDGILGKAANIGNATRYFSIPQTGGLLFGASTDFTVSMWVKGDTNWSGDPSFISNKDWDAGTNNGWIVAGATNGSNWQWNINGTGGARKDFDSGGNIRDGQWHLITVTHDRDGNATFYQDDKNLGTVDISGNGNSDTAFPLCIGADGELDYIFDQEILVDDVKIWRRTLSAGEIQQRYSKVGFQLWLQDQFTPAQQADPAISGKDADPDGDGKSNTEEFGTGSNPLKKEFTQLVSVSPDASGTNPTITWAQPNGGNGTTGVDYNVNGVTYCIEYSTDLVTWNSGVAYIKEKSAPEHLREGWHTASVELVNPVPASDIDVFFRLKMTLAE